MRDNPLIGLIIVLVPFSLLSFGGGPSIFAPLERETVDVMGWLTSREFIDLFAIARTAPGPGAMLSTLIGWKVAGLTGAFVATLALFLPSSLLAYAIARAYDRHRGHVFHSALEIGLTPLAVGLVLAGAISILRLSSFDPLTVIAAIGAGLVLSLRPKINPFLIIFAGAAIFVAAEFLGLHG